MDGRRNNKGIVGKAGSDFDIDKLNIFQPYYVNYKGNLLYLDKESLPKYEQYIEQEIKILENLPALAGDKQNIKIEIRFLKELLKEAKKDFPVEKNEMYEISQNILSAPENLVQLLTPNTASTLKALAEQVQKAYGVNNDRPMRDLISWSYNNIVATNNWVGKAGVGITALHITTHRLFQEVGIKLIKGDATRLNFNGMYNSFSIDSENDIAGENNIAEVISQFLNSYVDIAREPFILDLNAGTQIADVYFYLIRRGVPIDTAVYFMNQPIVREYVNERLLQESEINVLSNTDKPKWKTIAELNEKYKPSKEITINQYSKKELEDSMGKKELDNKQKNLQIKVLEDFLNYQTKELGLLLKAINQDTKFGKTENDFILKQNIDIPKAKDLTIFEEGTLEKVYDNSLIGGYQKIHSKMPFIYKELTPFLDSNYEKARDFFVEIYKKRNVPGDEAVKVLNLLANDWITFLLETQTYKSSKGNPIKISNLFNTLFDRDIKNYAKLINQVQKGNSDSPIANKIKNNAFINSIVPIISSPLSEVDNVKVYNRKMSADVENTLVNGFQELLDMEGETTNRTYLNIIGLSIKFAIAQSGLSMSHI